MQFYMCYAQGFPGETYQSVMVIGTLFIFDSIKEARKEYGGIYWDRSKLGIKVGRDERI